MLTYLYKEVKESLRYRIMWVNLFITPFFMFAPFVFIVDDASKENVLIGLLCWYELNQLFFGISSCLLEERMNGTFINLFIMPIKFFSYLLAKGLWIFIQCILIILFTIGCFALCNINVTNLLYLMGILCLNGIFMYCMSVLYLGLVVRFHRLGELNYIVQQIIGLFSGYTTDLEKFPSYLKTISLLIPLTYIIVMARDIRLFTIQNVCISSVISILCFIIGYILVNKQWNKIREKGDMNQW